MNRKMRLALAMAAIAGGVFGPGVAERTAFAQGAGKPSQAQETNIEGVTAEVTEAVRKEGVLTIKMRLRNAGAAPTKVKISQDWADADKYYPVAGSTKFLVLKDSQKIPLMVQLDNYGGLTTEIKPNGSFLFWAKYPAPPADAKKFTFYNPHTPPIEDIPITEGK
jgi:hypothetical protein